MNKSVLILIFFSFLLISEKLVGDEVSSYVLLLGTKGEAFTEENSVTVSGGPIGGKILISINNNPIDFHSTGATAISLNEWLKDGANSVEIQGSSKVQLKTKIVKMLNEKVDKVLMKKNIEPLLKNTRVTFEFEANCGYELPIFDSIIAKNQSEIQKNQEAIFEKISVIHNDLFLKKSENATMELTAGFRIWQQLAYKKSAEEIETYLKSYKKFLSNPENKFMSFDSEAVKYEMGNNTVMVFLDFEKAPPYSPFLFTMKTGIETLNLPPISFSKLNGEWIVWK